LSNVRENKSVSDKSTDYISIGVVVNAHGIKGELKIHPLTDEPEQFENLDFIYLLNKDDRKLCAVENVRFTQKNIILKIEGVDDRTSAENLKNSLIDIKISDLRPLGQHEYYIFDLIGLRVLTTSGDEKGEIVNVIQYPANDVYVLRIGDKEHLIPAIKEVVMKIDLDEGVMIINPIDGLFE